MRIAQVATHRAKVEAHGAFLRVVPEVAEAGDELRLFNRLNPRLARVDALAEKVRRQIV